VSQNRNFQRSALKSSKRADLKNLEIFYLNLKDINWISSIPKSNENYTAQIRYHGEFLPCKIVCESPASAKLIFEKPTLVASGQSCVLYDKDVCLGGGTVA
jgi:tRNA-specific 2-thiouridylase